MIGLLRSLQRTVAPKPLEPSRLLAGGEVLEVVFRRHAQARRLVLRLNATGTGVLVTVPRDVSRARALEFAERSRSWIEDHMKARGGLTHLADGAALPLRGIEHDIRHVPGRRGVVTADRDRLYIDVPGDPAHLKRRLHDFLKAEARADLTKASAKYAALMGVKFRRIAIRDQRSRWGSCSASGDLSYSWRLILAPGYVLDYVAAHEVAHLRHLDHSPRFWRLVRTHCPDAARARNWLRLHGQDVHRVVV
ncbi:MAG: M48 family metallopeptidase [Aestuariivirga sp.]|uniref:M48 family metallopeptidase n=1 Tax=Aestuariivirga sp. TaxID=2650926 RepID=UPI0025C4A02E|nr:SprT family zinc-dependent metalloprotease [Aestuariivirga sp.]MCA3562147.1 M48 family metallopeptidase [Aestuariivirga sp.]